MPPRAKPLSSPPQRFPTAPVLPFAFKHWHDVTETRSPWIPEHTRLALEKWWREVQHATDLVAAGERVYPLLLNGETRCGKTSSVCALARTAGLPVRRMDLGSVVSSYMGETARVLSDAFTETAMGPLSIWLIDEIDGVAQRRGGDSAPDKERAHAVATLLTKLEHLAPTAPLVATTNMASLVDPAVLARFTVVEWSRWDDLSHEEARAFAMSHGDVGEQRRASYADAVQSARSYRVERILSAKAAAP